MIDYFDGDVPLQLGECPRCSHRWTRPLIQDASERSFAQTAREILDTEPLSHAA